MNPRIQASTRIIEIASSINESVRAYKDIYQGKYPADDIRFQIFHQIYSTTNSLFIFGLVLRDHTSSKDWWESNKEFQATFSESLIEDLNTALRMLLRFGFFHAAAMLTEDTLRKVGRAIDSNANSGGTAPFKNIYTWLFARTDQRGFEGLLDLLRSVRNTIHNNGVFLHKDETNLEVKYQEVEYYFEHGKQIDFRKMGFSDTLEFFKFIFPNVCEMFDKLFQSSVISSIEYIPAD